MGTKRSRVRSMVVLGGLLCLLASGCSAKRLTLQEFLTRGDAICKAGNDRIAPAAEAAFGGLQPDQTPDPVKVQQFFDVVVAEVQMEFDEIKKLEPPKDVESKVNAMLASLRSALDGIKQGGATGLLQQLATDKDPFEDAKRKATDLGLKECTGDEA